MVPTPMTSCVSTSSLGRDMDKLDCEMFRGQCSHDGYSQFKFMLQQVREGPDECVLFSDKT